MIVEPRWLLVAEEELGIKEVEGQKKHNPRILAYHATTNLGATDDETAWCSGFVNWAMLAAGHEGTGRANARSWMDWGQGLSEPAHGCITVLWRVSRGDWRGHVGFLVGIEREQVYLLGGNQKNSVSIQPYPCKRVLGFRWPGEDNE